MTNFHRTPEGTVYASIVFGGRTFSVTYAAERFVGFLACDVYDYITSQILNQIQAEADKNILDEVFD